METSVSACSNKGTLSEHVHVTNGRGDDISRDLEEPELTNASVNDEERSETVTESAQNFDEGIRSRKLTEKGSEEKIKRLKQKRTTALSAVTRKRRHILKPGRWTMDGGRWTVDDGRWTMDGGQWTMDDGRWTFPWSRN